MKELISKRCWPDILQPFYQRGPDAVAQEERLSDDKAPPAARQLGRYWNTGDSVVVVAVVVGRNIHPERSRGRCPIRAIVGPLPCGRNLHTLLTESKE